MKEEGIIYEIAARLEGEAGTIGLPGYVMVADTMLARLNSKEFPNTWSGVLRAYYGYAKPSRLALLVARVAVEAPWLPYGFTFVYSASDRRQLDLPCGDLVLKDGALELHFYTYFPLGERPMAKGLATVPTYFPVEEERVGRGLATVPLRVDVDERVGATIRSYLKIAGADVPASEQITLKHLILLAEATGDEGFAGED